MTSHLLEGRRFTRLEVLRRAGTQIVGKAGMKRALWECRCDCGNIIITNTLKLRIGDAKSCGCLRKEYLHKHGVTKRLEPGGAALNCLIGRYTQRARERNIEFSLTREQLKILFESNCHYCGIEPVQILHGATYYGDFRFNGIDKKDPSGGYTIDNVVPCCWRCNRMKSNMEYDEFCTHIRKMAIVIGDE